MVAPNGSPAAKAAPKRQQQATRRNTPFLPTPLEAIVLSAYPVLLVFGTVFSLLNPNTRAAPYDEFTQAHDQGTLAPSYFARKNNLFNTLFVKRGWAWFTVAFFLFLFTHPAVQTIQARTKGAIRWGLVTLWWILVTQWCFGPAIIDRGFRFTGGKCEVVELKVEAGEDGPVDALTAAACKSAGGRWRGGHDISGHVFMLVLGSFFLLQEVGWAVRRWRAERREERSVIMHDGAVKNAEIEAERRDGGSADDGLGLGGKIAGVVVALSGWMILMTAIYFHTWFEKLTGLMVALSGLYVVYVLPRWSPPLRAVVGLPGI